MTALEAQAAQLDPATGRRTRVAVAAACGVLWTVSPQLAGPWYERQPVHPWWGLHVMTVSLFGLSFLGVIWGRESLMRTQVNRRVVATGTLVFAMQLALERGCSLLGLPWHVQVTLHLVVWALGAATLGLLVDRRFWLAAIAYVAAFLVAAGAPAHLYDAMSGGNFALLVIFLVAWWRPVEDFSGGRR